jgi:3-hydroxyisobutyrate dehydrogenase-like beta-hydroxyacid dehydrogenase
MSNDVRICLLGFGEVGQTLAADLHQRGFTNLVAWDLKFADAQTDLVKRAKAMTVEVASSAQSAAGGACVILSAVTAAQAVPAAQAMAPHLQAEALFVDLNSASPAAKCEAYGAVEGGRGLYVEAVVMAPISPKRIASPVLLGGPNAHRFAKLAPDFGFSGIEVFSETVGQASAAKMCRSVIIKGLEALLTESLVAARHYGVEAAVIQSLQNLLPGHDWRALAQYMMSRSMLHGVRRAEEMREVAITVKEAGVTPWMSSACAERQQWAAQFRELGTEAPLEETLDRVLAAVNASERAPVLEK